MTDICNSKNILDSRDVIEQIEELTNEREALTEAMVEAQEAFQEWVDTHGPDDEAEGEALADAITAAREELKTWESEWKEGLDSLVKFADGLEGYGDWEHGETLIRESYFTDYCQEMLEDCGDLPRELPSYIVIDWDATANNLRVDYTESELDGVTYLMRA